MGFNRALVTLENMYNGIIGGLPDFVLAVLILLIFYIVAKRTRLFVMRLTEKQRRAKNLGVILGKLAQSAVIVAGLLVVLTILFPSFQPRALIQLLGIGSVAIGFAFHDLFQNFLAGLLLLLTAPFKIGDQIVVTPFEGTVEDIAMRATTIKTYDGRRVVIPNTDLFTNSVIVNTAFDKRCLEYDIGIGYNDEISKAKAVMLAVLDSLDGVLSDPPAEARVTALGAFSVTIRISCWTKEHRQDNIELLQDKVLTLVKEELIAHGITLPFPTQQVLLQSLPNVSNGNHSLPNVSNGNGSLEIVKDGHG